jgi:hypothetical protein
MLLAGVLLVYWWRSNHGHTDSFTLGKVSQTQSRFTADHGRILLEVTDNLGGQIITRITPHRFQDVLGYFLLVPGIWLAIKVRSLLPRPPGRLRNAPHVK